MHPRIRREQKCLCAFTSSAATDGWNYLQRPGTVGPPVSKVVTRHMSRLSHVTHTGSVVTKLADCSSYVSLQSCHKSHVTIVTRHTGSAVTIVTVSPQTLHARISADICPCHCLMVRTHKQVSVTSWSVRGVITSSCYHAVTPVFEILFKSWK